MPCILVLMVSWVTCGSIWWFGAVPMEHTVLVSNQLPIRWSEGKIYEIFTVLNANLGSFYYCITVLIYCLQPPSQEFTRSSRARRRYWARSYAGWRRFTAAQPGPAHTALASLEKAGRINFMITQNVDRYILQFLFRRISVGCEECWL